MRISLARKTLAAFIVCAAIPVAAAFFSFHNSDHFISNNQSVHMYEVLCGYDQLPAAIDVEACVSGFFLSGSNIFPDSLQRPKACLFNQLRT
jgi:hypothetical protein